MNERLDQLLAANPSLDPHELLTDVWIEILTKIGQPELRDNGPMFIQVAATLQTPRAGVALLSDVIALFLFEYFQGSNSYKSLRNALLTFENEIRRDGGAELNKRFAALNPHVSIPEHARFSLEFADALRRIRNMRESG
jgi:hypothetical protein